MVDTVGIIVGVFHLFYLVAEEGVELTVVAVNIEGFVRGLLVRNRLDSILAINNDIKHNRDIFTINYSVSVYVSSMFGKITSCKTYEMTDGFRYINDVHLVIPVDVARHNAFVGETLHFLH